MRKEEEERGRQADKRHTLTKLLIKQICQFRRRVAWGVNHAKEKLTKAKGMREINKLMSKTQLCAVGMWIVWLGGDRAEEKRSKVE